MPDREKVIKGLEHCLGDNCNDDKWDKCEYRGRGCIGNLLEDALALLKAQEPVEPQEKREGDYRNLYCGACGRGIVGYVGHLTGEHKKLSDYCCNCGKAVKWE